MKFDTKSTKLTQMEIEQSYSLIKSNDVLVNKADKYLMPHKDWLMGLKAAVAKN
jgi:tryptophan halogenase